MMEALFKVNVTVCKSKTHQRKKSKCEIHTKKVSGEAEAAVLWDTFRAIIRGNITAFEATVTMLREKKVCQTAAAKI